MEDDGVEEGKLRVRIRQKQVQVLSTAAGPTSCKTQMADKAGWTVSSKAQMPDHEGGEEKFMA